MRQEGTAFLQHAVRQSYIQFYPVDLTAKRGFASRRSLLMEVQPCKNDPAIFADFQYQLQCCENLVLIVFQLVRH